MRERKGILVVDDEPKITEVICSYLENKGYAVFAAETARAALDLFEREDISLVILDLMLPDLSGQEVCRQIRRTSSAAVIMLTAKVEEDDLVEGLGAGADDYVTKPFSLRALHARVEAVLRRVAQCSLHPNNRLCFPGLEIDADSHGVICRGQAVCLTQSEFKLLLTLARHPQKAFSREELIAFSLGMEYEGYDRTVDSHIKNLRRKIEEDPQHPRWVQTVHGVGYRFGGDV